MQNRRKFLAQTSLAAGAFAFLKPIQTLAGSSHLTPNNSNTLTILYTSGLCEQWNRLNGSGGIHAVTDAVSRIKKENNNLLLVDAGNILSADSEKNISHLHYFTALKTAGFDVITPGSNDMQHGADYFSKLVDHSRLKAVATNYYKQGFLEDAVLPYRIIRKGNIKVGIIGVGTDKTKELNHASSAHLVSWVNNTAASLKQNHNCKIVICISHLSLKDEKQKIDNLRLAEASTQVDMIISDNDKRFTYNSYSVKNKSAHDVFVTHAGNKGTMLGRIDITLNNEGEKINIATSQVFTSTDRHDRKIAMKKHFSAMA